MKIHYEIVITSSKRNKRFVYEIKDVTKGKTMGKYRTMEDAMTACLLLQNESDPPEDTLIQPQDLKVS